MNFLRTLLLAAVVAPVAICDAMPLAGDRLVEVARAELEARTSGLPGNWEFVAEGGLRSEVVAADARIQAVSPDGRWPRKRIGVPVQVWADDRPVQSRMVWFTVHRWQEVPVYARDARAGDSLEQVSTTMQRRDMAEFGDRAILAEQVSLHGTLRLRRSVRAGQPVMHDDLEASPAVARQKNVTLTVHKGPVTISTRALAQEDAAIGDPVRVLPSGAKQWVQARVTGPNEVAIEE